MPNVKKPEKNYDQRPRFGWSDSLDTDPQILSENRFDKSFPVVVIPLPYQSEKLRRKIRDFVNGTIWPKNYNYGINS
jgi:hypothetical protein